ncbi:MAG: type II toxin-antitoxin system VapC family toxin [Thermodesulfovibrionales bacterium]|nr:type II toxin-antitoxin system VapC family toxin [Thermodesulfovibrionales bacterium]
MKTFVVDASVVIKWLIPEVYENYALLLLNESFNLCAPDLLLPEIGNVLWKKVYRGEITEQDAHELLLDFIKISPKLFHSILLMETALSISMHFKQSFYDSLYLSLAQIENCALVTADLKLYNTMKKGTLKKHILWIENIPNV